MHDQSPTSSDSNQRSLEQRLFALEQELLLLRQNKTQKQHRVRHSWRTLSAFLLMFGVIVCSGLMMGAAPPSVYSGYLEEKGKGIDGKRKVNFSLYTAQNSGSSRCGPIQFADVLFVRGRFKLSLPAVCQNAIKAEPNLWVDIQVADANGKMQQLARMQLGNTPHTTTAQQVVSTQDAIVRSTAGKVILSTSRGKSIDINSGNDLVLNGANGVTIGKGGGSPGNLSVSGKLITEGDVTFTYPGARNSLFLSVIEQYASFTDPGGEKIRIQRGSTILNPDKKNINFSVFGKSPVPALHIEGSNSRVGINSASPQYHLDVNGTIRTKALLNTSDQRLKKQISTIQNALATVSLLRGVKFQWKNSLKSSQPNPFVLGVLAQQVETVVPEAVRTGKDGYKSVSYTMLIPLLIESIKQLKQQNTMLQKRLHLLEQTSALPEFLD